MNAGVIAPAVLGVLIESSGWSVALSALAVGPMIAIVAALFLPRSGAEFKARLAPRAGRRPHPAVPDWSSPTSRQPRRHVHERHHLLPVRDRRDSNVPAGGMTPLEVLDAQLARAQADHGELGALTEVFADEAREHAAKAAERYRAGTARPLEGITVAAKEKHMIAGHRVSEGFCGLARFYRDRDARRSLNGYLMPEPSSTPARRRPSSRSPGLLTRSCGDVTRNPWNTQFSPGGSSGGAGAALAAGFTTLATASDIGGSTRGPSSFTGERGIQSPVWQGARDRSDEPRLLPRRWANGAHGG